MRDCVSVCVLCLCFFFSEDYLFWQERGLWCDVPFESCEPERKFPLKCAFELKNKAGAVSLNNVKENGKRLQNERLFGVSRTFGHRNQSHWSRIFSIGKMWKHGVVMTHSLDTFTSEREHTHFADKICWSHWTRDRMIWHKLWLLFSNIPRLS